MILNFEGHSLLLVSEGQASKEACLARAGLMYVYFKMLVHTCLSLAASITSVQFSSHFCLTSLVSVDIWVYYLGLIFSFQSLISHNMANTFLNSVYTRRDG